MGSVKTQRGIWHVELAFKTLYFEMSVHKYPQFTTKSGTWSEQAMERGVLRWLRRSRKAPWIAGHLIPTRPNICRPGVRLQKETHTCLPQTNKFE